MIISYRRGCVRTENTGIKNCLAFWYHHSMGIHAKIVQVILGHSSIAMLMNVYSHVLPTMQQNAMGMLVNAFMEQEYKSDRDKNEPSIDD
ncbi:MAG TPA: hypothetical protein DDW25_12075 [Ktedonobacter sp.]|nr:hypothetical protein [Ktedonobacter sp.]